jgi:hypothetical protein
MEYVIVLILDLEDISISFLYIHVLYLVLL